MRRRYERAAVVQEVLRRKAHAELKGLTPCLSYGRISNQAQEDGNSLDFQSDEALAHAKRHDMEVCFEINSTESAKEAGRPNFNLLLEVAEITGVRNLLFRDPSRVSRNSHDATRIEELIETGKAVIHIYSTGRVYDEESDPMDIFTLVFWFSYAKLENRVRSKAVAHNHKKNRERGVASQSPSRGGYIKDTDNKYVKDPDPEVQKQILYIFDEWDSGNHTLRSFVDHLNDREILTRIKRKNPKMLADGTKVAVEHRPWSTSSLHQFLTNPFWHGQFYSRKLDKIFDGSHEPYYAKSRWEERCRKLGERFLGVKKRDTKHAFSGLLRCTCGLGMTGQLKKGRYVYYTHDCRFFAAKNKKGHKNLAIREEEVHALVDARLEEDRFSDRFAQNLKDLFEEVASQATDRHRGQKSLIARQIADLEKQKRNLVQMLASGLIDDAAALNAGINDINAKIATLQSDRHDLTSKDDQLLVQVGNIIDDLRDLPVDYLQASEERKPKILKELVEYVEVAPDKRAKLHYRTQFAIVMREKILDLKKEAEGVLDFPKLLPRLGSNQRPSD